VTGATAECWECGQAQADPHYAMYRAGCAECGARMLAIGAEHAQAMSAAQFTPAYAAALKAVFGADWMRGHERVRAWSRRLGRTVE